MANVVNDIALKHKGKTVVAMGGGPSLTESAKKVKGDVWISANDHGARLRQVDYCVAVDTWHLDKMWRDGEIVDRPGGGIDPELRVRMRDWLDYGVPIVSYRSWADHVTSQEAAIFDSGMYAAYVAWLMGGCPAVIIGVDCYRDGTYWHDRDANSGSLDKPIRYFLSRAKSLAELIGTERVRVIGGGPLADHFPQYDPAETIHTDFCDVSERLVVTISADKARVDGISHARGNIVACRKEQAEQLIENGEATLWR